MPKAISHYQKIPKKANIMQDSVGFPAMILKNSVIEHNLQIMADLAQNTHCVLAPHGKTTMSPELLKKQCANGAWGMTIANVNQAIKAVNWGVKNLIIANQVISKIDLLDLAQLQSENPEIFIAFFVDCVELAEYISAIYPANSPKLKIFIELGVKGGRTGFRAINDAKKAAIAIAKNPIFQIIGIATYEGVLINKQKPDEITAVRQLMQDVLKLSQELLANGVFDDGEKILITAGGSAVFDIITDDFKKLFGARYLPILRSGCYITHDHIFYEQHLQAIQGRNDKLSLKPAIEVWCMVQSLPEDDLAILTIGKRDIGYDLHLPKPIKYVNDKNQIVPSPDDWQLTALNDQHGFLKYDATKMRLKIGMRLALGVSHPCTTFEKWQNIFLVDDNYEILDIITTDFS